MTPAESQRCLGTSPELSVSRYKQHLPSAYRPQTRSAWLVHESGGCSGLADPEPPGSCVCSRWVVSEGGLCRRGWALSCTWGPGCC